MNRILQRSTRAFVQLRQASSAAATQGEAVNGKSLTPQTTFGPVDPRIRRLQEKFQDPMNEKPSYLQGGQSDIVLVFLTALLIGGGLINAGHRVYEKLNA